MEAVYERLFFIAHKKSPIFKASASKSDVILFSRYVLKLSHTLKLSLDMQDIPTHLYNHLTFVQIGNDTSHGS
jgi:hypothetical protein